MRRATNADLRAILDYLSSDVANCIYIVIDVSSFGLEGEAVSVELDELPDGSIRGLVMRYYDSYQVYSRDRSFDVLAVADLARAEHTLRISAPRWIAEELERTLDGYTLECGVVVDLTSYRAFEAAEPILEATVDDVPEIVDLLMTDEMWAKTNDRNAMIRQFRDRMESGAGRSWIIRKDGTMVAHLAIAAETDDFMVASYTIVHPDFRDVPYGAMLDSYLINTARVELGKSLYTFLRDPRRIRLFKIMGNEVAGEYGQLYKS